jgi:hypothetical protein
MILWCSKRAKNCICNDMQISFMSDGVGGNWKFFNCTQKNIYSLEKIEKKLFLKLCTAYIEHIKNNIEKNV